MISAENTSLAGLIGGIEQVRNKRFLKWGAMPLMDKRFLVLDEVSGMSYEEISRISGIRSSGIAEITKIITARTNARVRQLWISNPRQNKFLHDYNTAIEALPELIKNPEDIARFDLAVIFKEEDVSFNLINSKYEEQETTYTSDLGRKHLLFCWSRKASDIVIKKDAHKEILRQSIQLSKTFSPEIPLIHSAEMRIKLARMGIALASLLFNINEEEQIVVEKQHIDYLVKILKKLYKKAEYDLFSEPYIAENNLEYNEEDFKDILNYGKENFVKLLRYDTICIRDINFIFKIDEQIESRTLISQLIELNLLRKKHTYWVKTRGFIEMLKRWKRDVKTKNASNKKEISDDIPF
jgi:hypothetical protein